VETAGQSGEGLREGRGGKEQGREEWEKWRGKGGVDFAPLQENIRNKI